MKNENDPVVKEIPVYLSKTLAEKLLIFQYPLRPAAEGYDNASVLKSAIKPNNQEVQMDVAIDTSSITYDHDRGHQIALDIDGPFDRFAATSESRVFDREIMNKIHLQSSRAIPDASTYSVGVYQDGEFHITPIKGIVQLRPQFNYLEKMEKLGKDDAAAQDENDTEEEIKQVNVSFAREKSDFAKKMRELSFQQHSLKLSEERWIEATFRDAGSHQAEVARQEMFCPTTEAAANNLKLSIQEYLNVLAPPVQPDEHVLQNLSTQEHSLNYIRTLPLLDQIRILLKDARVISLPVLRSLISLEHDTTSILKYLQQTAVLVQGNWAVNSELIYPKDTTSQNGVPAELMCRARDYILHSFTMNDYIDKRTIDMIKLPAEDIKEILENLGKLVPKRGWQLIVPSSNDFAMRYPEIAQRQESFWEAKMKSLKDAIGMQNRPPNRQRKKSNRESVGSENEERNVGRGRKNTRESSVSDDEPIKGKNRSRKKSETT